MINSATRRPILATHLIKTVNKRCSCGCERSTNLSIQLGSIEHYSVSAAVTEYAIYSNFDITGVVAKNIQQVKGSSFETIDIWFDATNSILCGVQLRFSFSGTLYEDAPLFRRPVCIRGYRSKTFDYPLYKSEVLKQRRVGSDDIVSNISSLKELRCENDAESATYASNRTDCCSHQATHLRSHPEAHRHHCQRTSAIRESNRYESQRIEHKPATKAAQPHKLIPFPSRVPMVFAAGKWRNHARAGTLV